MPRYEPEPPRDDGLIARPGILLVNLGTPDAPTAAALRRYLGEFLSDPRVVEIPRPLWWPLLHGVILNTRPAASARKYARIWSEDGSPLRVHTERQARLLSDNLARRIRSPITVEYAMRYGTPALAPALSALKARGCDRILVLPLYPQYSASATASVFDAVSRYVQSTRNVPELRLVRNFHDHPAYVAALTAQLREHWNKNGRPDRLLMSFHGLPRYTLLRGDPYHSECQETARLLAASLQLLDKDWQVVFQSRFGHTEWLQPYCLQTLVDCAKSERKKVDVICPGFVSDCLETLEEIGIEARQAFLAAGGREFHVIPCLNERDDWIQALADIAVSHLSGWVSKDRGPPAVISAGDVPRE